MQKAKILLFLLIFLITSTTHLLSQENSIYWSDTLRDNNEIQVTLVAEKSEIQPDETFWLALQFNVPRGWHCYWQNPGDIGKGPEFNWALPLGFNILDISWPTPSRFESSDQITFGYNSPFTILFQVKAPKELKSGETVLMTVDTHWLACSEDACMPGNDTKSIEIRVSDVSKWADQATLGLFSAARSQLPTEGLTAYAVKNNHLIALHVPEIASQDITHVEFFPQDCESINHQIAPTILTASEGLALALQADTESRHQLLRGVLVAHTQSGAQCSYKIETSYDGSGDSDLIALAESIPVSSATTVLQEENMPSDQIHLLIILGMAFLGGMILNLMPCVLPVISFKILGFIKMAGQDRRIILYHGLAFTAGVLISFWTLAGLLLALQAYGQSVGWGFQLQEPLFVGFLAAVMVVFALSMLGIFELGGSLASWVGSQSANSKKANVFGSFSSGILATIVATPCTGPFLGTAVGVAVTLPPLKALLIFTSLGLGMSLPYLLLAAFPKLLKVLPRPGAWMESFKQLMGFVLLASALWLVWVFGFQTGVASQSLLLSALFILSVACWIYGRWSAPHRPSRVRWFSTVVASFLVLVSMRWIVFAASLASNEASLHSEIVQTAQAGAWEPFDQDRLESLRAQGVPVFVDFTAKWCLICQANHLVLDTEAVNHQMLAQNVVKMKADWTKSDPKITAYLKKYGRNSVPLYLYFSGDNGSEPSILPQVLTQETVLNTLQQSTAALVAEIQ